MGLDENICPKCLGYLLDMETMRFWKKCVI